MSDIVMLSFLGCQFLECTVVTMELDMMGIPFSS